MSEKEIPHIQDIMKIRLQMKANKNLRKSIMDAIEDTLRNNGVNVSREAVDALIFVHPDEVISQSLGITLPVGSQCQAW